MDSQAVEPDRYVEPTPGVAKTIGALHLVFGSLLLLCVACVGAYALMLMAMRPMMQQAQAQMEKERQAEIDALRQQEEETDDEQEKQRLRSERESREAEPSPVVPDITKMWGLDDPRVVGCILTDVLTGLLLNLALIVAGVGLLRLAQWGRVLGLWLAWLKLVRLVCVYGFFAIVAVPVIAKGYGQVMDEMMQSMPRGNAPAQPMGAAMAAFFGTMLTVFAVGMVLLGAIYPVVTLWYLSRPGTKAACRTGDLPEPSTS